MTPNIPDEVVEAALAALIAERGTYENEVPIGLDDVAAAIRSALSLLLEQSEIWAAPMGSGTKAMYFNYDPTHLEKREPLYRLKVSK